jgi:hypothetical protein
MELLATRPRPADQDVCGRCGHRHVDHHEGDVCVECDCGPAGSPCGLFALYGFAEPGSDELDWMSILN